MKMRKMKDSGVEWIGQIPNDWHIQRIKTLANSPTSVFVDGDWINAEDISDEGIRYLTTGNVGQGIFKEQGKGYISEETFSQLSCFEVKAGDLVISRLNEPIGRACIIPKHYKRCVVAVDCVVLRPDSHFDKRFLMHTMSADRYADYGFLLARGTTMQRISRTQLGSIPLPIPPLPEQRKIATFLDRACAKIDEIIAGTKQTIEEYKVWKASLIFEAVTGKCRIENGKCRMGGRKMRDSGIPWLGEVPEGWTIKRFKFVAKTLRKGNGITKDEVFADGEIACIRYGEIYSRYNFVVKECASRTNRRCVADPVYVERGDILFACTGELVEEIGKNILYDGCEPCIAGGDILVASHNEDPGFLNYYLNCHSSQFQKSRGKAKLKVVHARTSDIENIVVLLPSSVEQRTIADYLNKKCAAIDRVIAEKEALIADLEAYRKSLIFEVVTGKRSVGENGLVA